MSIDCWISVVDHSIVMCILLCGSCEVTHIDGPVQR